MEMSLLHTSKDRTKAVVKFLIAKVSIFPESWQLKIHPQTPPTLYMAYKSTVYDWAISLYSQHKIILQNLFIFPSPFSWDNHLRVANNKSTVAYLCLLSANPFLNLSYGDSAIH